MNYLENLRENQPLIFNITNEVVTNFVANGLLALGVSPAMSNATEEAADMARIAQAVVLNIGTPTKSQVDAMILAGKTANKNNIPVILDPVAVGATNFRTEIVEKLLEKVSFTAIRGNMAEIAALNKETTAMRGVDSLTDQIDFSTVKNVAKSYDTIVVATGKVDVISDGNEVITVENGDPLLTYVTGAGCLLSSVVGAYATFKTNKLQAISSAVATYNIAGDLTASQVKGPGSFKMAFIDQLYQIEDSTVDQLQQINYFKGEE